MPAQCTPFAASASRRSWRLIISLAATLVSAPLLAASPAAATPALVVDMGTQDVLYADDAGHPWYPASTTKLMTALVTFEALQKGEVTLDTPVVMSPLAMKQKSLHAGLKIGRAMRLEDALYAAFAASANDVAIALSQAVAGSEAKFVERMNLEARRLGLTATHFANANGLFDPSQHVSARDLAILANTVYQRFPQYHPIFATARVIVDGKAVDSFNDLLTRFPGAVGMKTGFLCASGRNFVGIAQRGGRRVMVVLLGATTERERAERAAKFLTDAFSGALKPTGEKLEQLGNNLTEQPEDLRVKLCTKSADAYEAKRDALYPWGLPGHESYLSAATTPTTHTIKTWEAPLPKQAEDPAKAPAAATAGNVAIPTPRPAH
ncbi:D-alanyl-D-alanine carboxypeptidase [Jiella sp. MQZ9-1]|uniref:D-alanyl-D-alanine carboxypeptidase n=1 Tax=Jiella flava TaxID=2816857 RepID=A0A939JTL2_9HYPH|nr:D-alanyl-D-alanine carboxypeptidase family protein [Jiella flava]MBO0664113.1 D-alanyl-D-alanine carboxypeptidase [Jiella flava]MCD2472685.1 D-alanyl-D-alanine carboxypeptidase [Jiella flava]